MSLPVLREEPRGSTIREGESIPTAMEEVGCSDLGEKAKMPPADWAREEAASSSRGLGVVNDNLPAVQVEHTIFWMGSIQREIW
jgi:hypothetical protein